MPVGFIYGKITGYLAKVVVSANESAIQYHVSPGEDLIVITDQQYSALTSLDQIHSYLANAIGRAPSGYRAAMIDGVGNVVSVHYADPGYEYPYPGYRLIWDDNAQPNWLFANGILLPFPAPPRRHFRSPKRLRGRRR